MTINYIFRCQCREALNDLLGAMPRKGSNMKKHTYRVWIEQVNATYLDVKATSAEEAREIGYAKWRTEEAHSRVTAVEKQEAPNMEIDA